ncbi:MAG: extracellular solute-binding protein [Aestuariibacter sp.]|nr:extracellular solute-binding protein [Aestuariibacter sp.]
MKRIKRLSQLVWVVGLAFLMFIALTVALEGYPAVAAQVGGGEKDEVKALLVPTQAVTITYWSPHTRDREIYMQQLISEFNATNPYSITVQGQILGGYGEIHDEVIAGLQGDGPLPNIVAAYPNSMAYFARYGAVRFLDDYLDDPGAGTLNIPDFSAGVLDYYRLSEYGGQLAGLQHGYSVRVMYYNTHLITTAGITIPTTWDAFETACISLTTGAISGTIPTIDVSHFATWLWSRGGKLLSDDMNHARFDEQPGIESLLIFQELINGGYARLPYSRHEEQFAFANGQVGFFFGSSSGIPYYRADMESGVNHTWGVTRVPAVPGHEVVDSYGGGLGILHESEGADLAAWRFIRWLVEPEQTARWAARVGYFPVRISAVTHPSMTQKLAEDPQYAQAYALLPLGRGEPGVRGYNEIRSILDDAMTEILQNSANVTGTLQAAADETDAILAASGPDSTIIPPGGGTLVYTNTQYLSATVEFPDGALATTQTVSYVPLEDLPTNGLAFALVPNLTFSEPVTVTIHYRDKDIVGIDENALKLYNYDWSSGFWIEANPCGGYVTDTVNNILQAAVCHFSDYAMMGLHRVYLPVVLRSHTSL